jgi:hypothetical protein
MKPKIAIFLALALSGSFWSFHASGEDAKPIAGQLVEQFKSSKVFWQQFELGAKIVALHNTNVLSMLAGCFTNEDRHARGNAALIFAQLGDDRGFDVLREILTDRSARNETQGK